MLKHFFYVLLLFPYACKDVVNQPFIGVAKNENVVDTLSTSKIESKPVVFNINTAIINKEFTAIKKDLISSIILR